MDVSLPAHKRLVTGPAGRHEPVEVLMLRLPPMGFELYFFCILYVQLSTRVYLQCTTDLVAATLKMVPVPLQRMQWLITAMSSVSQSFSQGSELFHLIGASPLQASSLFVVCSIASVVVISK